MPLSELHEDGHPESRSALQVVIYHPMQAWLEALQRVLEPRSDITVVAGHRDFQWARQAATSGQAGVLLSYVRAPAHDLVALAHASPTLKVVAISDSEEPALVAALLRNGVRGWVQPNASVVHLVRVMRGVVEGETWVPPALLGPALDILIESTAGRQQASDLLSVLSPREVEMLHCLVLGMTRREIAERYTLSTHTVRTHINNVLHKLDVHSTLAAVSIARRTGLAESLPQQRRV